MSEELSQGKVERVLDKGNDNGSAITIGSFTLKWVSVDMIEVSYDFCHTVRKFEVCGGDMETVLSTLLISKSVERDEVYK